MLPAELTVRLKSAVRRVVNVVCLVSLLHRLSSPLSVLESATLGPRRITLHVVLTTEVHPLKAPLTIPALVYPPERASLKAVTAILFLPSPFTLIVALTSLRPRVPAVAFTRPRSP